METFHDAYIADEYGGTPNEQVEAAWARLWDCACNSSYIGVQLFANHAAVGAFTIPLDKIPLLNKSSLNGNYRQIETARGIEVGCFSVSGGRIDLS